MVVPHNVETLTYILLKRLFPCGLTFRTLLGEWQDGNGAAFQRDVNNLADFLLMTAIAIANELKVDLEELYLRRTVEIVGKIADYRSTDGGASFTGKP